MFFSISELLSETKEENVKQILQTIIDGIEILIVVSEEDVIGTILDVRAKDLIETTDYLHKIKRTKKELLLTYLQKEGIDTAAGTSASIDVNESENSKTEKDSSKYSSKSLSQAGMKRKRTGLFPKSKENRNVIKTNTIESEIDSYLHVQGEGVNSILDWWRENQEKFKNIALLARKYLPILIIAFPEGIYGCNDFITKCNNVLNIDRRVRNSFCFLHFNRKYTNKND